MPRCSQCNKFVSVEVGEPEANLQVTPQENGSALVTGDVRIYTQCGECSTDLSETNQRHYHYSYQDVEIEIPINDHNGFYHEQDGQEDYEFEIEEEVVEAEDRFEGKGRGAKHFYGARIEVTVKCACGGQNSGSELVEEQASSMESLE